MEVFHWSAKLSVRHHRPPPLLRRVSGTVTTTTFLLTLMYCDDSVHGGLLDKLIWEDAERGISCSPVLMTVLAHLCLSRQASWPGFHVCLNVVILNSSFRCFWKWCSGQTSVSLGRSILWVFCSGSGPFRVSGLVFCLVCCFLWRNASLAGGFAGRRGLVVLCVFWLFYFDLPARMDQLCPCTRIFSTAYAHVRTEPQSDIGQTRGKKN